MRTLNVDGLGLCACGALVSHEDYPPEVINESWRCPKCMAPLTPSNFGKEEGSTKRTRWVGPGRQWTNERPEGEFFIGDVHITLEPLPMDNEWHPPKQNPIAA